jgi:hypothetical protein
MAPYGVAYREVAAVQKAEIPVVGTNLVSHTTRVPGAPQLEEPFELGTVTLSQNILSCWTRVFGDESVRFVYRKRTILEYQPRPIVPPRRRGIEI